MTTVVNIKKKPYDVYCGRPGKGQRGIYGNPFNNGTRSENIVDYYLYFHRLINKDQVFTDQIESLRGKTLGCFCKPLDCHVDVIVSYLENGPINKEYLLDRYGCVLNEQYKNKLK